ncbi:MAG: multicopper oxidase domain-containing protein [Acidobacteriota bacterium]
MKSDDTQRDIKRRDFLKMGLGSAAAFTLGGLVLPVRRTFAGGVTVNVTLVAESYTKTLVDGSSVTAWRFRNPAGGGPGGLDSGLVINSDDTLNVTVTNNLDRPINFVVPGLLTGTATVAMGASRLYSISSPAAGSYLYRDDTTAGIATAMGLAGPLVVMPAGAGDRLYPGGPTFDRQYTLFLQEIDDRLNSAIAGGGSYDLANYEPNYYFLNGLSHPGTKGDADTRIVMSNGEDVAIRMINGGTIVSPMHYHGYHVDVATRDRVVETAVVAKDTVLVRVDECVDVILQVDQVGMYPLHTHYVPGVTANGVYVNPFGGALTMLEAT